jgi:hypothetical protein
MGRPLAYGVTGAPVARHVLEFGLPHGLLNPSFTWVPSRRDDIDQCSDIS